MATPVITTRPSHGLHELHGFPENQQGQDETENRHQVHETDRRAGVQPPEAPSVEQEGQHGAEHA